MKRIIIILSLMAGLPVFAQTDRIDSLLNDLIFNEKDPLLMPEKPVKYNFINFGMNYNSNTFYAGREIGINMYNVSGYMFYFTSSGLFFGLSGNWFDQLTPGYSSTILSAGYNKALGTKKLFTLRSSYSRFIYNKSEFDVDYPYNNSLVAGLSFRNKWLGARVSSNLLFGDEYKLNMSAGLFTRFTLIKFGTYNKMYTYPDFSVFFSTETVETSDNYVASDPSTSVLKDVYGLLNTQIYLPLGISLGDFDLEIGYSINIPVTKDKVVTYPVKSLISVSLGYLLPVKK